MSQDFSRIRRRMFALPVWLAAVVPLAHAANPTTPIQHVVVIFQENVSFDHYFATYPVAANNSASEPVFHAAPGHAFGERTEWVADDS